MSIADRFDAWFQNSGPAALVLREPLMAVEGHDGVIFPATFAPSDERIGRADYNVDEFPDGRNVCLIDSVGSQANRIEPIFGVTEYAALVPQIVVRAGTRTISILAAGHRAADALVRCTTLRDDIKMAFKALLVGNAEPLARLAPTSLVFGAWDSRDTQAKTPRLLSSTIRAYDVRRLTRSATYVAAVPYVEEKLVEDPGTKDALSKCGFANALATATPGGVIATGGVRRDATLHLAALRLLHAETAEKTQLLRRYVLGLALTAFTYTPGGFLRQGCNLVRDPDRPCETVEVHQDGRRAKLEISHADAFTYAKATAGAFGVATAREVDFDRELGKREVAAKKGKKKAD